jgi:predicted nicotinamide N-methyase
VADDLVALWEQTELRPAATTGEPPFWAVGWAGGQGLARYVLDHPELVRERRVLDLACGGGLVAIAAALAGGQVTAVDTDPLALAAARVNARANGVTVRCICTDLLAPVQAGAREPSPSPEPAQALDLSALGVVLAGDVFYARAMAARVEPFLWVAGTRTGPTCQAPASNCWPSTTSRSPPTWRA